uniref:Transposase Tc1-like domain-containing protein n=1 Tax=Pygocentrus nattereri TaxID=42514 RepID=A0AAR2K5Q1_PYGNA
IGKKGDLSDFERGMVVGARRAGLKWSKKEKISSEQQLCGRKCLVDVRGQRRMGRLVQDGRKATVTQITTCYNQGMQNTISECTTCRTLKKMGYSSRRPHWVPLLSAKKRKLRLQFTQRESRQQNESQASNILAASVGINHNSFSHKKHHEGQHICTVQIYSAKLISVYFPVKTAPTSLNVFGIT